MKRARDAITGRWVSLKYAVDNPATTVVEEHPSPAEYSKKPRQFPSGASESSG